MDTVDRHSRIIFRKYLDVLELVTSVQGCINVTTCSGDLIKEKTVLYP